MLNTWKNQLEHLVKGSRHIYEGTFTHMATIPPQASPPLGIYFVGKEGQNCCNYQRIHLYRVNNPTLNRNSGWCNMQHIQDGILFNAQGLRIKNHQELPQQMYTPLLVPSKTNIKIADTNSILYDWLNQLFNYMSLKNMKASRVWTALLV